MSAGIEVGERFGHWVVVGAPVRRCNNRGHGRWWVPCRCACGAQLEVVIHRLRSGRSKRCGKRCAATAPVAAGDRFGSWTIVGASWLEDRPCGRQAVRRARVRCDCGFEAVRNVPALQKGESTQCRSCAARARKLQHGQSGTPTYNSWQGMNHRCYVESDVAWRYYGGRGIAVCARWRAEQFGGEAGAFERFLADMGERPAGTTLDRIDSSGPYEPENCRWATPLEQTQNRRRRLGTVAPPRGPVEGRSLPAMAIEAP